jgi:predicted TIM-barrel fold metal-dependent hydrolase
MTSEVQYVDSHVHVASHDHARYPLGKVFENAPTFAAPIEDFRTVSGSLGVVQAVLIQPSMYSFDHSYLMECLQRFPDECVGVALVDPLDPGSPDLLSDLVARGPVTGVRFALMLESERGWLEPLGDPVARRAAELGLVVNIFANPDQLASVESWLTERDDLTVVIDHLGRPDLSSGPTEEVLGNLLRLARYPRVHVKLSALPELSREPFPHEDTWQWARVLLSAFGVDRCMWGSDFPFVAAGGSYADALVVMSYALPNLSPFDRTRLLCDNAREVYRLPKTPRSGCDS